MKTTNLAKYEFIKKVANSEENDNEWKYLGDKPALIVYKINTQEEQDLTALLGICSIPSLLFVPMDEQPQMSTGALPKDQLKESIENVLLKK